MGRHQNSLAKRERERRKRSKATEKREKRQRKQELANDANSTERRTPETDGPSLTPGKLDIAHE